MGDKAIQIEGLGKRYYVAHGGARSDTLRDTLAGGVKSLGRMALRRLRGRGHGEGQVEERWALRDLSLDISQGEVVGIIGRNGAGKSTLLKLLSRITEPTQGRVKLRGRVASLLEVGTGFHSELTGRENIYLNGAILGMTRSEIRRKFDEIVEFSGIGDSLEMPVKRYSSGMYMRLAFAVAAHLDTEVLIIDEVLAVGDMAFQKKCLGRMDAIAKQHRTILFVSHDLSLVRTLCTRGVVLERGQMVADTTAKEAAYLYANSTQGPIDLTKVGITNRLGRTSGAIRFTGFRLENERGQECTTFRAGETAVLALTCVAYRDVADLGLLLQLRTNIAREMVTSVKTVLCEGEVPAGTTLHVRLALPDLLLRPGDYLLYICLGNQEGDRFHDVIDDNVCLPSLSITSDDQDLNRTCGYFSIPWQLHLDRVER